MTKFYDKDQLKNFENGIELKMTTRKNTMTNDIKEILETLKNPNRERPLVLYKHNWEELIDYITNLQEEKQRLLESADCLSKGYSDLEKRIDKAIEYIEEYWRKSFLLGTWEFFGSGDILLNILRGDE